MHATQPRAVPGISCAARGLPAAAAALTHGHRSVCRLLSCSTQQLKTYTHIDLGGCCFSMALACCSPWAAIGPCWLAGWSVVGKVGLWHKDRNKNPRMNIVQIQWVICPCCAVLQCLLTWHHPTPSTPITTTGKLCAMHFPSVKLCWLPPAFSWQPAHHLRSTTAAPPTHPLLCCMQLWALQQAGCGAALAPVGGTEGGVGADPGPRHDPQRLLCQLGAPLPSGWVAGWGWLAGWPGTSSYGGRGGWVDGRKLLSWWTCLYQAGGRLGTSLGGGGKLPRLVELPLQSCQGAQPAGLGWLAGREPPPRPGGVATAGPGCRCRAASMTRVAGTQACSMRGCPGHQEATPRTHHNLQSFAGLVACREGLGCGRVL